MRYRRWGKSRLFRKVLFHCVIIVNEQRFLYAITFFLNFIIYLYINIASLGIIYKMDFCIMHSSILTAIPVYSIANLILRGICHRILFVKYAIPMPLKEMRINVILTWCNERSVFNRFEIFCVILLAYIIF